MSGGEGGILSHHKCLFLYHLKNKHLMTFAGLA